MRAFYRFRLLLAAVAIGSVFGCKDEEVAIGEPGMQGVILRDKAKALEVENHRNEIQKEGEGIAYGN